MPHVRTLVLSLVALLAVPAGSHAQEEPLGTPSPTPAGSEFFISPEPQEDPAVTAQGYFVFEISAGDQATGNVQLRNPGPKPVTVELATVDAETAQAGGSAFVTADTTPAAAGTWVHLAESQVILELGEQTSVEFTVNPPSGTAPGQYLAGISAFVPSTQIGTPTALGGNQAGASIDLQTRYVIGVQVEVPGEWTPSLSITGASALEHLSGTKLGIAMRNNGDTFLKPEGSVTLTNAAATPILTQPIQLDTFVTGTDITYPIAWPGVPVGGEYGVAVELNYGEDQVASYRGLLTVSDDAPVAPPAPGEAPQPAAQPVPVPEPTSSFIQPWMILAIIGLLVLMVVLLAVALMRSRRSSSW